MSILNSLLQITIFSGVIFLATLLLKKAFKNKMSPFMHFAVWAVFLLRLIVPVTLDAPIRIFTYQPAAVVTPIQTSQTPSAPIPVSLETINVISDEQMVSAESPDVSAAPVPAAVPASSPVPATKPLTTDQIVLFVWLGGTALGLLYIVLLAALLRRKIAIKSAPASAYLQALLAEVKNELHIKARLRLLCQYECGSPALLFPRTILMPMDKLAVMDDEQIKNCLRHECMHYKRRDHLTSLFLTVLNAVYWFNPFLWLAYYEIRKDMETACDGAVVKQLDPTARRGYAELILNLSGKARQIPMVLAMSRSKKSAERRIKGIFMAQTSKRSVKFVSITLALVLLLCCFTTACQPTPAKPVVINKSGGISGDMIADPLPPGALKEVDAQAHWKETMTLQNGHVSINADVDVNIPDKLSNTPVYKLEQIPLTQEKLEELTHYFVKDKKLYKPLPMARLDGLIQLQKIKDGTGMYGQYDDESRKLMAKKLQDMIDNAPASAEKVYSNLAFTSIDIPDYGEVLEAAFGEYSFPETDNYLTVKAETGEEYKPTISASTYLSGTSLTSSFAYEYPGSFMTESLMKSNRQRNELLKSYRPADTTFQSYIANFNQYYAELDEVMADYTETPDQALQIAQKALTELGIDNMGLNCIEKGVYLPRQPQEWDELATSISDGQVGYSMTFERAAGQLTGFTEYYIVGDTTKTEMLTYTPPFLVESISIFVCNGRIMLFSWQNISQIVETVAQNTNLISFDKIKTRFADYLSYIYNAYDDSETEPEESYIIDIIDIQLRASQVTAKDDPYRAWLIPSWVIRYRTTEIEDNGTVKRVYQDMPCEINALDGGIIIPVS